MSSPSLPSEMLPQPANSTSDDIMSSPSLSPKRVAPSHQQAESDGTSHLSPESQTKPQPQAHGTATNSIPAVIEAPSMTGVTLETFHLFPKLPIELRLMVWRATFPRPRVIPLFTSSLYSIRDDVSWDDIYVNGSNGYHKLEWFRYSRPPPTPLALHINSESRQEALKLYELFFKSSGSGAGTVPKIYVNFAEDIFFIMGRDMEIDIPDISSDAEKDERFTQLVSQHGQYFIKPSTVEDLNKIQRLMVNIPSFEKQFLRRGRDPAPYFGLPAFLKELLVTYVTDGVHILNSPDFEFVEDVEEVDWKEEEGLGEPQSEISSVWKWGDKWDAGRIKLKKLMLRELESSRAQQINPDWKAPILRFGKDVGLLELHMDWEDWDN